MKYVACMRVVVVYEQSFSAVSQFLNSSIRSKKRQAGRQSTWLRFNKTLSLRRKLPHVSNSLVSAVEFQVTSGPPVCLPAVLTACRLTNGVFSNFYSFYSPQLLVCVVWNNANVWRYFISYFWKTCMSIFFINYRNLRTHPMTMATRNSSIWNFVKFFLNSIDVFL